MAKGTIVGDKSKTYYFDNQKNQTALSGEKINSIKDGYYSVMDGLNKLEDLLDNKEMSDELKIVKQAMKIMRKSNLESLWMKGR